MEDSKTPCKEKVISLFQFVEEMNKLKQKKIISIEEYPWYCDISNIPDDPKNVTMCFRDRVDEENGNADKDDALLVVHKPEFQECPKPDDIIVKWLSIGWDDFRKEVKVVNSAKGDAAEDKKPEKGEEWSQQSMLADDSMQLKMDEETAIETVSDTENQENQETNNKEETFEDDPERVQKYQQWLEERKKWVERQKKIEEVRDFFVLLYKVYYQLKRDNETLELIAANGMLRSKENKAIFHPVLTRRVKIEFDADTNTISVMDTDAPTDLYTVLFQELKNINVGTVNELNGILQEKDIHPMDRNETPDYLNVLVHQLSPKSLFSRDGEPEDWQKNNELLMYDAPCFILRNRLDGTVKAIEQIIQNIQETDEIPNPITDIVSGGKIDLPDEEPDNSIEAQLAAVGGESVDVLLSKEANREQLEIAKRIERFNAVLVQGPPGTGKTHTIANLMGHFLAQGKSVLVTSHTTKALNVLKDKVAPGLQNLCVAVLEDSNEDMERSVDGITSYMARTNSFEIQHEMERLGKERQQVVDKLADVRRKIYAALKKENNCIVYNGEEYTPSKAAAYVSENAEKLDYIPDEIPTSIPCPLSYEELSALYKSNQALTAEEETEIESDLPDPTTLVLPSEFKKILTENVEIESRIKEIASLNKWKISQDVRKQTISVCGEGFDIVAPYMQEKEIMAILDATRFYRNSKLWMIYAATDGRKEGAYRKCWKTLIEQIRETCKCAEKVVEEQFGNTVEFVNPDSAAALKPLFVEIKKEIGANGKLPLMTKLLHKDYVVAHESVKINGHYAQSPEECSMVIHAIELDEARKKCATYWDKLLPICNEPRFEDLDALEPERIAKNWIYDIQRSLDWYKVEFPTLVRRLEDAHIVCQDIFGVSNQDSDAKKVESVFETARTKIPDMCEVINLVKKRSVNQQKLADDRSVLQGNKHLGSNTCLKLAEANREENSQKYEEAFEKLSALYSKKEALAKREELLDRLAAVAPKWADAIRNRQGVYGDSTVPIHIEDAWKWKQLAEIVEEVTKTPFQQLQKESLGLSKDYRKVTALYAEKCGWYHLLRKTETDISMKQALQGWKQTVKKIGKGTGKTAPRYRAEARKLMSKCQEAVPCWIMPIHKALESLNPRVNRFDVIIIDEASQADISSLAILYMGKKLIVVGDDKQVSPMAVGVEEDKTTALQEMYLQDKIPNAHLYNAKMSIYDVAATTFQPLMLREHFRCVPDIIGFSNMLSYDFKIKPLREASSSNIMPAVVNYRVKDGERTGGLKTNPREAATIVALMKACMEQKEYEGKTFGVISLLGDNQVKEIQQRIDKEIDSKDIVARNILCGNSANFQGDERDVIFLSMVDSNEKSGPLPMMTYGVDDAYRKRYNVAASRARDQLWVVDSLDAASDLKPGDLRKRLIDYSMNPKAFSNEHRKIEKKSESPFEEAVAKNLFDCGYHIVQQWEVGAYRIDMVALYKNSAVAIECDGERWHSGEDAIRADMERQTILERLGWRFIRIRGSEYYRDTEQTMERVKDELSNYGIEPEETTTVDEESQNDTDLLKRVRQRAAMILESTTKVDNGNNIKTIEVALNPKALFQEEAVPSVGEQPNELEEEVKEKATSEESEVEQTSVAPEQQRKDILELLQKHDVPYIDKRQNAGALWIVGGSELNAIVQEAKEYGCNFVFAKDGGKATKGKPGWWTK